MALPRAEAAKHKPSKQAMEPKANPTRITQKKTGFLVSGISISSTCTLMYDVITRSHTPAYSYAASVEVKF